MPWQSWTREESGRYPFCVFLALIVYRRQRLEGWKRIERRLWKGLHSVATCSWRYELFARLEGSRRDRDPCLSSVNAQPTDSRAVYAVRALQLTSLGLDLVQPLVLSFLVLAAPTPSRHKFLPLIIPHIPLSRLVADTFLLGKPFPFRRWFWLGQGLLPRQQGGRWRRSENRSNGRGMCLQSEQ